jgi:glycerol-3-phosphate acyltransferase PlsX
MVEGGGKFVKTCLKKIFYRNIFSKLAYVFARSSVKALQREMDYSIYGGAPFLGIAKPVIKAHGSANHVSISVCVGQAKRYAESGMIDYIASLSAKTETKE